MVDVASRQDVEQIERAEYTLPQRTLMRDEPHSVLSDSGFTRSSIAIQFTSHVLPPSSENDCSKRHESGLISEMIKRTRMARPFRVSLSKNSPRPFLNSPIVGRLRTLF